MTTEKEIMIRPTPIYAFLKILPLLFFVLAFTALAWLILPVFILLSIVLVAIAIYRYALIQSWRFLIEPEFIRVKYGLVFKRTDQVEMFRVKDYVITRPLTHQLFRMLNLVLKTTDPENPIIELKGIPESEIVDIIRERVQQARKANKIVEIT